MTGDVFRPQFSCGPGRPRQVRDHSRQGISPCGIDESRGLCHRRVERDELPQVVFLHRLGQADLGGQRSSVGVESLGRADQASLLGPRFGFAVGDSDHDDLIIGQQGRVRADGFVEGEDMELGAENGGVVHRDEFEFQFRRATLDVVLDIARRGGHEQSLASLDLLFIQDGREQAFGVSGQTVSFVADHQIERLPLTRLSGSDAVGRLIRGKYDGGAFSTLAEETPNLPRIGRDFDAKIGRRLNRRVSLVLHNRFVRTDDERVEVFR